MEKVHGLSAAMGGSAQSWGLPHRDTPRPTAIGHSTIKGDNSFIEGQRMKRGLEEPATRLPASQMHGTRDLPIMM